MRAIGQEIHSAVRRLRQAPGFVLLATITLGLGIGASTAVFSVVDPLIFRSLPVRDPERLVLLHSTGTLASIDMCEWRGFEQYAADRETLDGALAVAGTVNYETAMSGRTETAKGLLVSTNFFDLLGVRPATGRFFSPADAASGRQLIVLAFDYWRNNFGSDAGIVGRTIVLRGTTYEIAGVAPRGFVGVLVGVSPDFYVPIPPGSRPGSFVWVVGRMRVGVTLDRARLALEPTFNSIAAASELPDIERQQHMTRLLITSVSRGISESRDRLGSRPLALMFVVLLGLLVACANVAGLVLTRAASRRQETAIELSLGATHRRLAGRFLVEGALVAAFGTAAGLGVAHVVSRMLVAWLALGPAPLLLTPALDMRVLAFAIAALGLTVAACGVLPAITAARNDLMQGLRFRAGGLDRGARPSLLRRALIIGQIATSITLLLITGLVIRSLLNLETFDVGYNAANVLAVTLRDRGTGRPAGQLAQLTEDIASRATALTGVTSFAFGTLPPLSGDEIGVNVTSDEQGSTVPVHTFFASAGPGYLATLGIPIRKGAECSAGGAAQAPTVVLNQRLARRLFGETDALGQRLRFVEGSRPPMTVVGIAADATYANVREEPRNFLYLCQAPGQVRSAQNLVLFVRGAGSHAATAALTEQIRSIVRSVDVNLDVLRAKTLEEYRADSLQPDRLVVGLFSGFTIVAVLIAAVGLYSVLAATVARQTSEIGLRVALGASTFGIMRFIGIPAAVMTATGLAFGIGGGLAASSLVGSLLFGVGRADPVTCMAAAIVFAVVCALACAVPLRRALGIDPVVALRAE